MALIFDIETDGFLENVTKIHCLVIKDTETGEVLSCTSELPGTIETGLKLLMKGDTLIAQNGIKFDIPVIQKLYPWFTVDESKVIDTLVLSRLIYSDLRDRDGALIEKNKSAVYEEVTTEWVGESGDTFYDTKRVLVKEAEVVFPPKLWGSHSLKAWGYRLGMLKGEYGQQENAWETFTPEMLEYCIQDVEITQKLYEFFLTSNYSQQAIDLEHQAAWVCARMERSGWPFDVQAAAELYSTLVEERDTILKQMTETFEPIVEERISEKTGKRLKDKVTPFNPSSRQQIAERLITKYDWKPKDFTPSGQAKIDEDVLSRLPYPEAKTLARYFLVEKRVAQLAEGEQAWLKLERGGILHGSLNPNGAATGRATHQQPNLAQVPTVRSPYGKECRSLFTVRPGFSMVGCDLSGLELRCLAHFMHKWDDGAYGETVVNGKSEDGTDIHTVNQKAAGLPTRDNAKTFIYGWLYGAGDAKIGSIVGGTAKEGKVLKEKFLKSLPALAQLKAAVGKASKRGYLIGLDGRRVHIRSEHAALNFLLQGSGALISKQWLLEIDKAAQAKGLKYGWDGDWTMLGYIHDEVQLAVRDEIAEEFGQMVVDAAKAAGDHFNFKIPIGAEFKVGKNWADTH